MESSTLRTVYDEVLLTFEEATDRAEDVASSKDSKPGSNLRKVTTWLDNATSSLISWGIDIRVNTDSLSAVVGTDVESEIRRTLCQLHEQVGRLFENGDFEAVSGPSVVNKTAVIESPSGFAQSRISSDDDPLVIMSGLIGVLKDFVRPIRMMHASRSKQGPYQELKRRVDDIYQQHVERKDLEQNGPPIVVQPITVEGAGIAEPDLPIVDQQQVPQNFTDGEQELPPDSSANEDLWRDLGATLRNSCEKNWEGAHFMIPSTLIDIMSDETVARLLSIETPPPEIVGTSTTTRDLQHCRKVLAICLYARLTPTFFYRLAQIPVSDHDLPIQEEHLIHSLSSFKEDIELKFLQRFCNTQWVFSPVRLEANQSHAHFPDSAILPIICDPERDILGRGLYGVTYKVGIDPNLHGLDPAKNFAMKRYPGLLDEKSTELDAHALSKEMSKLSHENLIRQVSTWSSNQNTYILFPLGDTNLRELLDKRPAVNLLGQVKFLDHLHEITSAVEFLHDHNSSKAVTKQFSRSWQASLAGWHMDLKPENIIVKEGENNSSTWLIADIGLPSPGISECQKTWYGSPESSSTLYQPAENQKDAGRQYDVWSLGCIFLEILVTVFGAADQSIPRQLSGISELWLRSATTGKVQLKPEVLDTFNNLRQLKTDLPMFEELLNLVWGTLEVDHQRRLSILELKDGLASILAQTPGSAFFNRPLTTITDSEDFDESDRSSIFSDDTRSGTQTPDSVYSASENGEHQGMPKWQTRSMYPFLLHGLEPEPLHDEIANTLARRVYSKANIGSSGEHDQASPSAIQRAILRSLSYPDMRVPEEHVPVAHEGTCKWFFEQSGSSSIDWFSEWLDDTNAHRNIFWIQAKPGSGKSVLMKYIAQKQRHEAKTSKGESRLTTVTHFFTFNGTVLQRSHIGFLRSLLHQIFSERTDLLHILFKVLFKDLWKTAVDCTTEFLELLPETWHNWSLSQLKRVLGVLPKLLHSDEKFLLLVDGLDESDDGCLQDIIHTLQYLSSTENFKICSSSRPTITIRRSFDSMPGLRLEEWTGPDIRRYVRDQVSGIFGSTGSNIHDEDFDSIDERIVSGASGVFLWVRCVVAELVEGIRNEDTLSAMSHRLDASPKGIEDLYSRILGEIEFHHRIEPLMCLQIAVAAQRPLSLEAFNYALSEQDVNTERITKGLTCEKTIESISRCRGLLEVGSTDSGPKILFVHLSAREFLKQSPAWAALERIADQRGFDVNVALLRASIFEIRSMMSSTMNLKWEEWSRAVGVAINYAREAEQSTGQAQTALLDHLDMELGGVMRSLPLSNGSFGYLRTPVHWSATLKHKFDEEFCDYCPDSFLACAVMSGLTLYVKSKISVTTRRAKGNKSLLFYATLAPQKHEKNAYPSAPIVQLLLEHGADPNEKTTEIPSPFDNFGDATISSKTSPGSPISEMTPWHLVLRYLHSEYLELEYDAKREDLWLQICLLFLRYGADPHVREEIYPASETLSPDHVSISPDTHTDRSDLGLKDIVLRVFPEVRLKESETFQKFRSLLEQKNLGFYRAA